VNLTESTYTPWLKILILIILVSVSVSTQAASATGCGESRIQGCSFTFQGSSASTILSNTPPRANIAAGQLQGTVTAKVLSKMTDSPTPTYNVSIIVDGAPMQGSYRLSQAQLNSMSQTQAALDSSQAFANMSEMLKAKKQCAQGIFGQSPVLTQTPAQQPQLPPQQAVEEINSRRYSHRTTDDPEERQNHRERTRVNNERVAQGDAPIASGRTIAVGSGSGLINMREDDEGVPTPECDHLRVTPEEATEDEGFTNENLAGCISAIQQIIMRGFESPAHPKDRNEIFSRLFTLPNEEQEFAAALFTLAGETNASEKPMDRLMILKVLSNRRNNGNRVQDEIKECRETSSEDAQISECIAQAQSNARFNLLDLALDTSQFSMYNDCPDTEGMSGAQARRSCSGNVNIASNWFNNLGNTSNDFSDEIDIFLNYENLDEIKIHGERSGSVDLEKIYHYVTPNSAPRTGWVNRQPANSDLRLSGVTKDGEELEMTTAHWFYYNVDTFGQHNGDGITRTPSHDFRQFGD
jgi:hypothetical protein